MNDIKMMWLICNNAITFMNVYTLYYSCYYDHYHTVCRTSQRPPGSRGKCSDTSDIMVDLIGHQEIENPIEFLKVMKAQLVASEW